MPPVPHYCGTLVNAIQQQVEDVDLRKVGRFFVVGEVGKVVTALAVSTGRPSDLICWFVGW